VAKGYSQVKGVDFNDTYAPVSRFTTFRAMLAKTAQDGLFVKQLDIKNAFLYGELEETDIYMHQPPGFEDGTGRSCQLVKSLYGLKQAPLVWYYHIEEHLLSNGWTVSESDWALFVKQTEKGTAWLLLYVDDILVFSKEQSMIQDTIKTLVEKYNMHEENLTKYLGINVCLKKGEAAISLPMYVGKLESRYEVPDPARPVRVPMSMDPNTEEETKPRTLEVIREYQSHVGSLMFAASTVRTDLQLACSRLSLGNKSPSPEHQAQVLKSLRYLFDTKGMSLIYRHDPDREFLELTGYTDANYQKTGCSQSGYIFLLAGAAISWASKRQTAPTLSSTEAELVAAVTASQEAIYLRRLLKEMGHEQRAPTVIYTDNSAVLDLVKTERRLGNSKHFNRLAWLRHQVKERVICLRFVRTTEQAADYLTKVLPQAPFSMCLRESGLSQPK
jgi:hypothetical protein